MLLDNEIYYLSINTQGNNYRVDLANLEELFFLEYLGLPCGSFINVSTLEGLTKLKSLFLFNDNDGEAIDLSKLRSLKRLYIQNSLGKIEGIESLVGLHTLSLQKLKATDLQSLSSLTNLESLELVQSTIESLDGISLLKKLKCLTMFYCSKLSSLKGVEYLSKLEYLKLDTCKALSDYHFLADAQLLKYLFIGSCGAVNDLKWLHNLKRMNYIGLIDTDVTDGDVSCLLSVPDHRYTNKKHFNYYQNKYGVDIKR